MKGIRPPPGAESAENDGGASKNGDDSASVGGSAAAAAARPGATTVSADDAGAVVAAGSADGVVNGELPLPPNTASVPVPEPIGASDAKGANATARSRPKTGVASERKAKAKGKGRKNTDLGKPTKRGKYDVVEPSVWREVLLEYYYSTDESELPTQVKFCRSRGLNRTTFRRYWRRSELCELKNRGEPVREAEVRLDAYLGTMRGSRGGGVESSKKPWKGKETKKKLALKAKRKAKLVEAAAEARRAKREKAETAKSKIWRDLLLEYYGMGGDGDGNDDGWCSQAEFCRRKGLGSAAAFGEKWRESGLRDLRAGGESLEVARRRADAYLRIRDPSNGQRGEDQTDETPITDYPRRDSPALAPLATVNSEAVKVVARGKYGLVKSEVWCDALVEFYGMRDEPMARFCLRKKLNRSTFGRHWSASNLPVHRKAGRPVQFARSAAEAYFEERRNRLRDSLRRMHDALQRRHDTRTHGALMEQAKVTARRLRREHLQRNVLDRINARVRTGRELGPREFDDLCRLIREPFKYTTTDDRGFGVTVLVNGDDATACVPLASSRGTGASKKRRRSEVSSVGARDGREMDQSHSPGADVVVDNSDKGKRIKTLRKLLGDFFKHKQDAAATSQPHGGPPYYQPTAALSMEKLNMFLRIFTPHCGKICSSDKQAKVEAIASLHLTQQMVDGRIEDLTLELNNLLLAQEQAKENED